MKILICKELYELWDKIEVDAKEKIEGSLNTIKSINKTQLVNSVETDELQEIRGIKLYTYKCDKNIFLLLSILEKNEILVLDIISVIDKKVSFFTKDNSSITTT